MKYSATIFMVDASADRHNQEKTELSDHLADEVYRFDFNEIRAKTLEAVSVGIEQNLHFLLVFAAVHVVNYIFLVASLSFHLTTSPKEKIINVFANLFACVPPRRARDPLVFLLLTIHSVQNIFFFYVCLYLSNQVNVTTLLSNRKIFLAAQQLYRLVCVFFSFFLSCPQKPQTNSQIKLDKNK